MLVLTQVLTQDICGISVETKLNLDGTLYVPPLSSSVMNREVEFKLRTKRKRFNVLKSIKNKTFRIEVNA